MWGRKVRNTINENQNKLSVKISADSSSASRWNTNKNGGMITAGVGGPITGRGANLIIVDDPIKNWKEAQSETIRKSLINWFYSTLYTRAEPGCTIIIIQTRWHESDLVGELLLNNADDWKEIRLPAFEDRNDQIGREYGEALCPDRFDEKALKEIKKAIGSTIFEALYQQNPAPPEGNMFKRKWWKYYNPDDPIEYLGVIQSWDCAYEVGPHNSYSVCQTWGLHDNGFYLLNQFREKLEYPDLVRAVQEQANQYNPDQILIEYQASGRSLVQDLLNKTRLPIHAQKTNNQSKETNAMLVTAVVESGKVFLPKSADWINDFLHELSMFPSGKYSDQVDALSQAISILSYYTNNRRKRLYPQKRPSSGREPLYGSTNLHYRPKLNFGPQIDIRARFLTPN
jgi:predicted phage terminase large subunit-like protein